MQRGRAGVAPFFDVLTAFDVSWTASAALNLLPENAGPRIEVSRGCVVVTAGGGADRRTVQRELGHRFRQAARAAGLWAYHSVNLVSGDDLFIPDPAVLRTLVGEG
ncbi:hypothetical protein [Micromonospora sp. NPDC051296]|uniref:hypothetical protein n=1 Tax=Micromonospora sp. NPDC051296 TaxID=3155046 RepID=UPI00343EEEC2